MKQNGSIILSGDDVVSTHRFPDGNNRKPAIGPGT